MNNEVRLIDANALLDEINNSDFDTYDDYSLAYDLIDSAPTIDAEHVRHANWETCCDGYYPYCSHCTNEPQGRVMTKFCPNCGAKMDGGGDSS